MTPMRWIPGGPIAGIVILTSTVACDESGRDPTPSNAGSDAPHVVASDSARRPDAGDTARASEGIDASRDDVITADGWGPLRIGMTRDEVVAAAGDDANPDAVGGPDPQRCDQFRPARAPEGLLVMVESGTLTRISLSRNTGIRTADGIRVGDPGSRVLDVYASRAITEPHAYWPSPAKYVTVWNDTASSGERRGIRYEIDADDRVVHIHAGSTSIEYVEGCL